MLRAIVCEAVGVTPFWRFSETHLSLDLDGLVERGETYTVSLDGEHGEVVVLADYEPWYVADNDTARHS